MTHVNPAPPVEIRLSADKSRLTLVWQEGAEDVLPACDLRARSPAAGEKRLRLAGLDAPVRSDLTLTGVRLLGGYGLNLSFSDGHDRGIYPWGLLKEIGQSLQTAGKTPIAFRNAIP
ncbi:gamma-butyrobetaine hydroxylase-like domain-containing protein [Xanthobacter agilis]|uniref:DUF971 family protein n=1 Tax=Xanthobacter agilis TaxID=47492 RepID=A0ABU0L8F7_XANAG|nr:gamma-butyrobetaine hydroxylase-like domain-containing protein [Xanthobacter agilis]MDQ0503439.1 DUF971 family protein [Xanthobacter agilis]